MKDIGTGESTFTRFKKSEARDTIPGDNEITDHVKASFADPATGRVIVGQVSNPEAVKGWFLTNDGLK
jgi:hypothetical protein